MTNIEEKNSYIHSFLDEKPKDGFAIPHARLLSALKLYDDFADYFRDRAQIEDTYAKSIIKLQKKNYIANNSALGTFLPLWEMLQLELTQLASIHGEFSAALTEQIEQPLRVAIPNNCDYINIQTMDDHMQKIAREYEDLQNKIQKQKKNSKGEAKTIEYVKLLERKLAEWKNEAPDFLQKHQKVDEFTWENLKTTIHQFETIQQAHAFKMIETTGNTMTAVANLRVDDEITAYCTSHGSNFKAIVDQEQTQSSGIENVVPEPSVSNISFRSSEAGNITHHPPSVKKDKKKFFSSLVSIRRKPKSDANLHQQLDHNLGASERSNRQRSFSNSGSFVESSSLHSMNTPSTSDRPDPNMAKSASQPSINNASSFVGSSTNDGLSQPPLILIDEEGYSIPPDRTTWPGDANTPSDSLIETDDMTSDGGSILSNPRIRVDIKNEAVSEEDASQSAVALSRMSTLLREKTSNSVPVARRIRATQLYSVIEQDHIVSKVDGSHGPAPSDTAITTLSKSSLEPALSLSPNPFEIGQKEIIESLKDEEVVTMDSVENLPIINVFITETVHVLSKAGEAEKSVVWGEIGVEYKGPAISTAPVCFQLDHQQPLDMIETTDYAHVLDGYTLQDNIFKINTQMYNENKSSDHHVAICIKYQTKLNYLPIVVKPIWKCEKEKSRLLVKYHNNVAAVPIENVMFATSVTGNVQNALSIPAGELVLPQQRIKWHLGEISDNDEAVIKAQFVTLEQATAQPIAVRFEIKNHLLSNVNVKHGTDALVLWPKICNTTKFVKAGKYLADV
ncbi:Muniscin C-terminal mu homology domain-containing protein [Parasitella parasitica]|nr:Muniscin C-terminal mu homology domain-containing protein [Parasitella parasitica]